MKPDITQPSDPGRVPGGAWAADAPESVNTGPAYQPPSIIRVGEFTADTHGSVSVGNSDDSDAGQYYAP